MIAKSFIESTLFNKLNHNIQGWKKKKFFEKPYSTPPMQIFKLHSIDCFSECSEIGFLQIEQKIGFILLRIYPLDLTPVLASKYSHYRSLEAVLRPLGGL